MNEPFAINEADLIDIRRGLNVLQRVCYEMMQSKGWHDKPATFGDRIALCHSELSEALEEFRKPKGDPFQLRFEPTCETPEILKPEGVPSELADVVLRIADLSGHHAMDLAAAVASKLKYNAFRPYKHGGKKL